MVGISLEVITHKLEVDPKYPSVRQKQRKFAVKHNKIREVYYPDWLTNVMVVQKKNGKWRDFINFTNFNKACLKDSFPLSKIDILVDTTAGNELLSFIDAYLGYNKILMHQSNYQKTFFFIECEIYGYNVMLFMLKNTGTTYQRLIDKMFFKYLVDTMEVYIDDILVKLLYVANHILHL